jgi:TolA-binding protein
MRLAVVSTLLASLSFAPVQCTRDPDPNLRTEDSAGDALWLLSQDFHKKNDEPAARATLKFLVERYPSNRHVAEAKAELEGQRSDGHDGGT